MSDVAPKQLNTLVAVGLRIRDESEAELGAPKVVGQRVVLTVSSDDGRRPENVRWTIPGSPVASFSASPDRSKLEVLVTDDQLRLELYWTTGGAHHVRVTAIVDGLQGIAEMVFEVEEPTHLGFSCKMNDSVTITPWKGQRWLLYGGNPSVSPGIDWTFSATGPRDFAGEVMAVQLIMSRRAWTVAGVSEEKIEVNTGGSYFLDADEDTMPYDHQSQSLARGGTAQLHAVDGPGSNLEKPPNLASVQHSEHFWIYFLYRPKTKDSIWVPLRRVRWAWHGRASRPFGRDAWSLDVSKDDQNRSIASPVAESTTTYPIWAGNYAALESRILDPFPG